MIQSAEGAAAATLGVEMHLVTLVTLVNLVNLASPVPSAPPPPPDNARS